MLSIQIKRLEKDHKNDLLEKIKKVVDDLANFNVDIQNHNHNLKGSLKDYSDIHIDGDTILVYRYIYDKLYVDLYLHNIDDHKSIDRRR